MGSIDDAENTVSTRAQTAATSVTRNEEQKEPAPLLDPIQEDAVDEEKPTMQSMDSQPTQVVDLQEPAPLANNLMEETPQMDSEPAQEEQTEQPPPLANNLMDLTPQEDAEPPQEEEKKQETPRSHTQTRRSSSASENFGFSRMNTNALLEVELL